jgi:flagellar biosynthetic protein FlhB
MAEESFQEKTEQATPKRIAKAREEGNVAKSVELNSVFILFFGLLTLYFLGGKILNHLVLLFKTVYQEAGNFLISESSIQYYFSYSLKAMVGLMAPLLIVIAIVGVGVNVAQIGLLFTTKPLTPNLAKLNPITGFKRLFALKSLVELVKGILKILIVGLIAYAVITSEKDNYLLLMNESVGNILIFASKLVFRIAIYATAALLVLAIFDFVYQKWQYKKNLMMTKQEVKEEAKEAEGDPLIKSTIRSIQRARARQRMMESVPEADVVVTNPTELAVALKYDPETMAAPEVVAKGARLIAQKIKEIATEHGIPIYENKPLAQSLYKMSTIGNQIPFELFHAVAEVFA